MASQYAAACILLTACAIFGWLLRFKSSKPLEIVSSSFIAGALIAIILQIMGTFDIGVGPVQYFFGDDYFLAFALICPVSTFVFTGLLCLIPERTN